MIVFRRVLVLLLGVMLALGVSGVHASAAPTDPAGGATPSTDSTDPATSLTTDDVNVSAGKWPSNLLWAVPGTKEFKQKYTPSATAAPHYTPIEGCGIGSDVYGYTTDFIVNLGSILGAMTTAGGKGTLPELATPNDKGGMATTPWRPVDVTDKIQQVSTGKVKVVSTASPGRPIKFVDPDTGDQIAPLTGGREPCAADFAPYGVPSAASPFGFGFYPAPDAGAKAFLVQHVQDYVPPGANETSDGWWMSKNTLEGWNFKPTDTQNYCTDAMNPLCLTAAFLQCPTTDGGTVKEKAAITNCRIWNANILLMNAYLTIDLDSKGVGKTADGTFVSALGGGACPGKDCGPVGEWLMLMQNGRDIVKVGTGVQWGLAAIGVTVLAGALLVGGLAAGLITLGVLVAAVAATVTMFGKLDCAADLGRCLAGYTSSSMFTMLDVIPSAALSTHVPDMTSPDYRKLFNTIAGIAAWLLILLFLIAAVLALIRLRPGEALVSFVGLIRFGFTIGAGGALLTMMVQVRDAVSNTLAGTGGAGTIIGSSDITDRIHAFRSGALTALTALASAPSFGGGILIALVNIVGMIAGFITWMVLEVSNQWIPLSVAILLLQTAGMAGPDQTRKWVSKGITGLWILLLAKPMVILVFRVGQAGLANATGLAGYLIAIVTLLACAIAPFVMWRLFPVGDGGPVGLVKALGAGIGSIMALRRFGGGASQQPGQTRESMNDTQAAACDDNTAGARRSGQSGGGTAGPGSGKVWTARRGLRGGPADPRGLFGDHAGGGSAGPGQAGGQIAADSTESGPGSPADRPRGPGRPQPKELVGASVGVVGRMGRSGSGGSTRDEGQGADPVDDPGGTAPQEEQVGAESGQPGQPGGRRSKRGPVTVGSPSDRADDDSALGARRHPAAGPSAASSPTGSTAPTAPAGSVALESPGDRPTDGSGWQAPHPAVQRIGQQTLSAGGSAAPLATPVQPPPIIPGLGSPAATVTGSGQASSSPGAPAVAAVAPAGQRRTEEPISPPSAVAVPDPVRPRGDRPNRSTTQAGLGPAASEGRWTETDEQEDRT